MSLEQILTKLPVDIINIIDEYRYQYKSSWTRNLMKAVMIELKTFRDCSIFLDASNRIDPFCSRIKTIIDSMLLNKTTIYGSKVHSKFRQTMSKLNKDNNQFFNWQANNIHRYVSNLTRKYDAHAKSTIKTTTMQHRICIKCHEPRSINKYYMNGTTRRQVCGVCHNAERSNGLRKNYYVKRAVGFNRYPEELRKKIIADIAVDNIMTIYKRYATEYPKLKYRSLLKYHSSGQIV